MEKSALLVRLSYIGKGRMMDSSHLILAYYHLTALEKPFFWVKEHQRFFENRDVKGRIYISSEGINGQMSGSTADCEAYMQWLKSQTPFSEITFKVDPADKNIFYKMCVKQKEQLVAFDQPVDFSLRGKHLSPQEFDRVMDEEEYHLIDVRNDYEMKIGHFETAELPACKNFREFKDYTQNSLLPQKSELQNKKILMYCTGGIRCEYYSAYLKEQGFDNVYQLEGGVINYSHQVGKGRWKGKLFVFDDRLACSVGESEECISTCHHCAQAADKYYNCANMDCNELFTCCPSCLELYQGCCQASCRSSTKLRPFNEVTNTPFRKWYHYQDQPPRQMQS